MKALLLLCAVLLAGCTVAPVAPAPTPTPVGAPVTLTALQTQSGVAVRGTPLAPGFVALGVELLIENHAWPAGIEHNRFGFSVVGADGFVYEAEWLYTDEVPTLAGARLMPGEKEQGWLLFAVPEDFAPVLLRYRDAWTGAGVEVTLAP